MTALDLICDYCARRSQGGAASCTHCGAPLSGGTPGHLLSGLGKAAEGAEKVVAEVGKSAEGVASVGAAVIALTKRFEGSELQQWRAALVGIVALAVVTVVLLRSWAPELAPIGSLTAVETLPEVLRSAAVCHADDAEQNNKQCVIAAADPLLSGGITGGRDLSFDLRMVDKDRLPQDIQQWRSAGATVVADRTVFIAVSPSWTIWYADIRSGLRIETSPFVDPTAARTFLMRSGLLRAA